MKLKSYVVACVALLCATAFHAAGSQTIAIDGHSAAVEAPFSAHSGQR